MIYLRYLDGIGRLEWKLEENGWTDGNVDLADDLAQHFFGVWEEDTHLWFDEDDGLHYLGGRPLIGLGAEEMESRSKEWEAHFDVLRLFRDESDAYWASVGWDVTDENGKQLECMRRIGRSLVCAVKGVHTEAKLNLGDDDSAEAWGASLAEEARLFKPSR